jgi:hypothetical protein
MCRKNWKKYHFWEEGGELFATAPSQEQIHIPLRSQHGLFLNGRKKQNCVRHVHMLLYIYVIIPLHLYC